jgi:hypothetical protein
MTGLLWPVTALLLSASILKMGNGLFGVLVPIRADLEHFSRYDIGAMGSFHFAGLMLGCLRAEPFVIAPKTTPAVFELDPRGEPSADVLEEAAAAQAPR